MKRNKLETRLSSCPEKLDTADRCLGGFDVTESWVRLRDGTVWFRKLHVFWNTFARFGQDRSARAFRDVRGRTEEADCDRKALSSLFLHGMRIVA